jgi:hypothetical protein
VIDTVAGAGEKLRALAGSKAANGAFLSVTLSTSRLDDWRQTAPVFLHSEFGRITKERGVTRDDKRALQADLDHVLDILNYELTPQTQGLAVFVDGAADFHERIELPLRLSNQVVVEPFPYVRPVAHALALLRPFVVARVSRDESSLYVVDEWGVASEDDLTGPWLRSSDRESGEVSIKEYYAAARQGTLVDLHFKEVAVALAKLLESSGVTRVVLCAQHDIATAFQRALPAATGARIAAEIPFDAAASTAQMVVSARAALEGARHEEAAALARRIKESLGRSGRGVSGFDAVLGTIRLHQLQTLLVDHGYTVPGWRCGECDWVGLAAVDRCPACGGEVQPLVDAVGELVRLAILQSAEIVVAEELPALAKLGGVAGLLRYA